MNRPSDSERVLILDSAHGDVHVSMTGFHNGTLFLNCYCLGTGHYLLPQAPPCEVHVQSHAFFPGSASSRRACEQVELSYVMH